MNWDQSEHNAKEQWSERGRQQQVGVKSGGHDRLHWSIQEIHGASKKEAERRLRYWESSLD